MSTAANQPGVFVSPAAGETNTRLISGCDTLPPMEVHKARSAQSHDKSP